MKRIINDKKAITLIALVITIVVLIILAAVAINLSLGDNGIFNRAKTAKEQYQNAQEYEEMEVAKTTNEIDSYVGGNRDYSPISYSTEEQDTGLKWLDGKTIFQSTITGTTTTSSFLDILHNIKNFDKCINVMGYVTSSGYNIPVGFYNGSQYFSAFADETQLHLRYQSTYNNSPYCITLQYTKK